MVLSPKSTLQLMQQRVYILPHLTVWQFPMLLTVSESLMLSIFAVVDDTEKQLLSHIYLDQLFSQFPIEN